VTAPRRPDVTDLVEIGRGGFGVVYRARQERFRRDVAVKVISATLDERARARFTQECRALGQLSGHPHIVPVYDGGVDPDEHGFLVMPFLPSGSLTDRMARSGPLAWREATDVGVRLAGALQTAHEAGILHRDLKPGNVLVDEYGAPRLADFGQARFADTDLTRSGEITATPGYAAPEIINGQPATPLADVYSLAATVMALILGRAPFDSGDGDGSIAPVLYRIMSERPPNLRPLGVPEAVAAVLEAAMAKDPAQRPDSAQSLGIGLQRAQQGLGLTVTPLSVAGQQLLPPPLGDPVDPARTLSYGPGTVGERRPDQTAVSPFPGGLTAALPGGSQSSAGATPAGPARRSRRPLVLALSAVVIVALAVTGVVVARELTAPEPAQGLVGSDLLLGEDDLPGAGWAFDESGSSGPLRAFVTDESLLTCLVLPMIDTGTDAGALDGRDVTVSDVFVDGDSGVQTAGIITRTPGEAQDIVGALRPPGRCPSELSSLGTASATDVDFSAEVTYESVDLPDLTGAIEAAGERIVVPLTGSDTGESTFVVELIFMASGTAVACAGLMAFGDEVPSGLRDSVVAQLAELLTE